MSAKIMTYETNCKALSLAMVCYAACGALRCAGGLFSNSQPITIRDAIINPSRPWEDLILPSSPYPSVISVAGEGSSLTYVTVTLNEFWHSYPLDVGIVVQSPAGSNVLLMAWVSNRSFIPPEVWTLTFDDASDRTPNFQTPLSTGTYRPTDGRNEDFPFPTNDRSFPFPDVEGYAKPTTWTTTLASFQGEDPNGEWKLFVTDKRIADFGAIEGGWSLQLTSVPEPQSWVMLSGAALSVFGAVTLHSKLASTPRRPPSV